MNQRVDLGRLFLEHKVFKTEERKKLSAKGQAMPGGGFPIRNSQDLKNAIQAYGRAKNKAAAKAWIIKRAKALGLTELLPEGWLEEAEHAETMEEALSHHGVKGQRWGVRRSKRQLERAARQSPEHKNVQALKGKKSSELSNQELKAINERLNLEQNFHRLNPTTVQRGHSAVKGVLGVAGTGVAVYTMAQSPAGKAAIAAGRKALGK
jgi:hypothetical protein